MKRIIQSASEIDDGSFRMSLQIGLDLTAEVILPLCDLQGSEESCSGFHLFSFLLEVVIQRIADTFGLRVGKQIREMLGADQPSEQRDDQCLLDSVLFDVILHFLTSFLQIPANKKGGLGALRKT
jgi:hypothetical protein